MQKTRHSSPTAGCKKNSGLTAARTRLLTLGIASALTLGLAAVTQAAESPQPTTDFLVSPDSNGDSSFARLPAASDAPPSNNKSSREEFLSAIDSIEGDAGAYDEQLSQHLLGLGLNYQELGEHDQAIESFKRAIHVSRINEGLYNLNQVPILERLIESHVARGEWEEANDRHHYFYWLHRRNYGEGDPRMLPVIDKLSAWHLRAYALDINSGLFEHLINAHNLFKLAVNIIDNNYGTNDLRLIEALRGLTISNYYLANYQGASDRGFQITSNTTVSQSAEERARLEQYKLNSYRSGKQAISRMVDIYSNNPESPPAASVKAKIELGDWYQMFSKYHSAVEAYQEAYNSLRDQDASSQTIERLFGKPVALPNLPLVDTQLPEDEEPPSHVLVRFDVTTYGRARNVEIVEANPPDKVRIRSRVRKSLKVMKFRPRFDNGEPVQTENVTHRYLFQND